MLDQEQDWLLSVLQLLVVPVQVVVLEVLVPEVLALEAQVPVQLVLDHDLEQTCTPSSVCEVPPPWHRVCTAGTPRTGPGWEPSDR